APAGTPTALHVARLHASRVVEVRGGIGAGSPPRTEAVAVDDPAELAGRVFLVALRRSGVALDGGLRAATPADVPPSTGSIAADRSPTVRGSALGIGRDGGAAPVAAHLSPPVRELLGMMNRPSDNHYAEILLRQVGCSAGDPAPVDPATGSTPTTAD